MCWETTFIVDGEVHHNYNVSIHLPLLTKLKVSAIGTTLGVNVTCYINGFTEKHLKRTYTNEYSKR